MQSQGRLLSNLKRKNKQIFQNTTSIPKHMKADHYS